MPANFSKMEQEIADFWEKNKIFEKSVENRPESKPYVFYDGPPFATGLPHYGHIVASLMKDVVPRYWTMKGYRVERRWGWDCHGLPIENIIEEKLKLKSKKDIERFSIDKFNEECRKEVLKYAEEWKKTIRRMGRWVDMENAYQTMDLNYMESVWWVFKQLWDKGLIYQGHKAMHICPRCVTPLSNFEVTQNYKEVEDISVIVKFELKEQRTKHALNDNEGNKEQFKNIKGPIYLLAWTTTPWTLPGNVLLAVNKDIEYWILDIDDKEGLYLVAKDRAKEISGDKIEIKKKVKGTDLVGLAYEPLFPYFSALGGSASGGKDTPNAFRVVDGSEFVSTEEGTGIVHIAPAFGEDDYNLGQREKVPLVQHVSMEGKFVPEVTDFAGMEVKPKDNPLVTDKKIVDWLKKQGKIFSEDKAVHSYPHCWRCETPLLNYATSSWFVKVAELKKQLLKNNEKINWVPAHIKEGRFGLWLEGARDWAISRNRYWGTPLPVWRCQTGKSQIPNPKLVVSEAEPSQINPKSKIQNQKCENIIAVGSVAESEKLSGRKINDLHKHIIDKIVLRCPKCGGEMRRIPEVLDCWFESGSMPYAQFHYPFENKKKFEEGFPAEFIAEGQDQTRGWFYTMHVLATALTSGKNPSLPVKRSSSSFKNVIVNGIVLAEDGKKMSKRLKNYPEPEVILDKYGADALRYYLVSSPVMEAENLNFSEAGVREMYNKVVNTLWNVVEFYKMYSSLVILSEAKDPFPFSKLTVSSKKLTVLDKWILAKLNLLIRDVSEGMENYELVKASRPIMDFIQELSTWWLRRSRARFKSDNPEEKNQVLNTLYLILNTLSKLLAPFMPFMAEKIYQELRKEERGKRKGSVHLEEWPKTEEKFIDRKILEEMAKVRKIVEMGLAIRAEQGIKVRQPLLELRIMNYELGEELGKLIKDELNIKDIKEIKNIEEIRKLGNWEIREEGGLKVALNVELTEELKKEGLAREVIRAINQMRKDKGLTIKDRVVVKYQTGDKLLQEVFVEFVEEIKKNVLAEQVIEGEGEEGEAGGKKINFKIEKV